MAILIGQGGVDVSGGASGHWVPFPLVQYYGSTRLVNTLASRVYGREGDVNPTGANIEAVADVGSWRVHQFRDPMEFNARVAAANGDIFGVTGEDAKTDGYLARYPDVKAAIVAERNVYSAKFPERRSPGPPSLQEFRWLAYQHYRSIGQAEGRVYAASWPQTYVVSDGAGAQKQITGDWVDKITPVTQQATTMAATTATDADALRLINSYGLPSIGRQVSLTAQDIAVWRKEIDRVGWNHATVLIRNAANAIKDRFPLVTTTQSQAVATTAAATTGDGLFSGKLFGVDKKLLIAGAVVALFFFQD